MAPPASMPPFVALLRGINAGKGRRVPMAAAGFPDSKAGAALLGQLGRGATTRSGSTTLKMHALAGSGENRTP